MISVNTWINAVLHPAETFRAEKPNATARKGILNYAIGGVLMGIIYMILCTFMPGASVCTDLLWLGAGGLIGLPIIQAIDSVIGSFLGVGIPFIFARILGGKGTVIQQYYLTSLFYVPMIVVLSVIQLISSVFTNVIGLAIVGIGALIVFLYSMFLLTIAIRETHEFSTGKAVLAWLLPVLIVIVLLVILVGAFIAAIIGTGMTILG